MDPSAATRGRIRHLPEEVDTGREIVHEVDHRWLRAYTTAVGDLRPRFFDMRHEAGLIAHPVFPACLEWPLFTDGVAGLEMDEQTLNRGLHIGQQLRWHHPISPGERLLTRAEILTLRQRKQGVQLRLGFETVNPAGKPVVSTVMDVLYRHTELVGEPVTDTTGVPGAPTDESGELVPDKQVLSFEVDRTNAIIYTECARIWNPVHTEDPAAEAAGLPAPVLHGTETLARAVSAVLDHLEADGQETKVGLVSCRFTGMVLPDSTLSVMVSNQVSHPDGALVGFVVHSSDGSSAISDGYLQFKH